MSRKRNDRISLIPNDTNALTFWVQPKLTYKREEVAALFDVQPSQSQDLIRQLFRWHGLRTTASRRGVDRIFHRTDVDRILCEAYTELGCVRRIIAKLMTCGVSDFAMSCRLLHALVAETAEFGWPNDVVDIGKNRLGLPVGTVRDEDFRLVVDPEGGP